MPSRDTESGAAEAVLDKENRSRILRAMGRMPYGGGLTMGKSIETVADVAEYLEVLADTLGNVAERTRANEQEQERLKKVINGGQLLLAELMKQEK